MKPTTPHKLQGSPLVEKCEAALKRFIHMLFGTGLKPVPVDFSRFTPEELLVWNMAASAKDRETKRVKQLEIVRALSMLRIHDKSDIDDIIAATESATRRLRSIITNIRTDHHGPIAADSKGYYIPENEFEVMEFLARMKRRTRAMIITLRVNYKAFQITYGIRDAEIERQLALFDDEPNE